MVKISILLPTFNGGDFLKQAVESVLTQSFLDWELLIIDDGSTDQSIAQIKNFTAADSRVRFMTHSANKGLTASLNEGLNESSGEFIARIDSDDVWSNPAKLQNQLQFLLQNPRVGLLGTWARVAGADGRPKGELKYPASDYLIRKEILAHNCFVHSSVLAPRRLMLDCGGYDPADNYVEDYGLWLRMGLRAQLCNLQEIMVNYRLNPAGITRSRHKAQVAAAANLVAGFKDQYPNYGLARVKWAVQKVLTSF